MKRRKPALWNRKTLLAYGLPAVLIPGVMFSLSLGWNPNSLLKSSSYYENSQIFPKSGTMKSIVDGDTFVLEQGSEVRLLGINAPGRGEDGYASASSALASLISSTTIYLKYDRYQDDKYGRILAWVWVGCENTPQFLPANYMYKSGNESQQGLFKNPQGRTKGFLVNERLKDLGFAHIVTYSERGALKYEERLRTYFLKRDLIN